MAPAAVNDGLRWSISYPMLIAAIVADVKALSAKVDQLEEVIVAQGKRIDKLEKAKRNAAPAR